MNIEFIDENTVKIEASIAWYESRPPIEKREVINRETYISQFQKKHPSYRIESIDGPLELYNFRKKDQSRGTWVLKVSKIVKSKNTTTRSKRKTMSKTTKQGA